MNDMNDKHKKIKQAAILVIWLALWQGAAALVHNRIIFVGPGEAALALVSQIGTVEFWRTIFSSFFRIAGGFTGAFLAGILTAALASCFSLLREFLEPPVALLQSVPVASFVILALIWIGSENLSILITCLVVFPVIYRNVLEGIRQTDRKMLETAQVFRMSVWKKIWYLYRPAVMPYLLAGCRISLGMAWKSGVAAEVIGVPDHSIGEKLYMAKIYLSTAELFAWTFVIIVVSWIFEQLFLQMLGLFLPGRTAGQNIRKFLQRKKVEEQSAGRDAVVFRREMEDKDIGQNNAVSRGETEDGDAGQNTAVSRNGETEGGSRYRKVVCKKQNRSETMEGSGSKEHETGNRGRGIGKSIPDEKTVCGREMKWKNQNPDSPDDVSVILAAESVSKSYHGIPVLERESLILREGDICCLMGPSGQGKTTLLRLLMGLERPDDGRITGSGRKRISAVFQEDRLCDYLNGIDNIKIAAGRDGLQCDPRKLLSLLLEPGALERPVRELSGGMKRRVAIARALAVSSDVVLMDEPFTGLDEETRLRVTEAVRASLDGRALLLVTHQAEDVYHLGARLIRLQKDPGMTAGAGLNMPKNGRRMD